VLKRIIVSIRNRMKGEWKKLHIEYLYGLYSAPNFIRMMKLRRMILKEQTAVTGEGKGEMYTGFWWGDLRERYGLEDVGIKETIILKFIGLFDMAFFLRDDEVLGP
jgi:hypothetical protein